MEILCKFFLAVCLMSRGINASVNIQIDFIDGTTNLKKLPRFWANTGFAPPDPIDKVDDFFESDDVIMNLEIIGSLPNKGIENIRIHWLLNLLSISNYSSSLKQPLPVLEFERLDEFLWRLVNDFKLNPTIEFMTTLKFRKINGLLWEDFAYQIVARYIGRYGVESVKKWKFETWNEPDLKGYNLLNFTVEEFEEYINGIKQGMKAAERQFSLKNNLMLRGPAGLFKDEKKHQICWKVLENCNENVDTCPIDIITFHRKGNGNNAKEILNGSLDLIETFSQRFPSLKNLKYANTEADPIKKWSEPRDFQADSRYAVVLVETVLQHWQAIYSNQMSKLDSISHDNSFLNFYPNFFTQRTLLARFQMNNTKPKHIQFVQKPVFSALGLIANLASKAGKVNTLKARRLSYVISTNDQSARFFSCILIWSHVNLQKFSNKSQTFEVEIINVKRNESDGDLFYIVEGIDNKRTNPWDVHKRHGSPKFPGFDVFEQMRGSQNPRVFSQPSKVSGGTIILNLRLMPPYVISVRICSRNVNKPKKVSNLRLRKVNSEEIIIFWSDKFYKARCIKNFEIFFKYSTENYKQIQLKHHVPFLYHQLKHTTPGCFKIRSRDIFNRVSEFSDEICYDGA